MKRAIPSLISKLFAFILLMTFANSSSAQVFCSGDTPFFAVDLSANPGMTWISPAVVRDGECCGGGANQVNCIELAIILHPDAIGINFSVNSGANPGGALFYQVNCNGIPISSGFDPVVCLDGPGPHYLSYCKVGNNQNTYAITSIPGPIPPTDVITAEGCSQQLSIGGTDPVSVTWNSISPGATGQYNNLLSNLTQTVNGTSGVGFTGFNDVLVNPIVGSPMTIQYEVCGMVSGSCMTQPFCDTVTVTVVPELFVNITPAPPYLCFGQPFETLTANVVGGAPPYTYLWNNGQTTSSINVTSLGNYSVTVTDATGCPVAVDDVTVIEFVNPITANAGPDLTVCEAISTNIPINGVVTGVTTGIWSGGSGTYSTSNTDLSLNYTMTAAEILAGSVTLTLTTTNNGTCPGDFDEMTITVTEMIAVVDALQNVSCFGGANGSALINASQGVSPYSYSLNGAPGVASNLFTGLPAGAYNVVVSDAVGCSATIPFTITQPPQLTFGTVVQTVSCNGVCDGQITVNAVGGTPPYEYSSNNGMTFNPSNILSGLCAGIYGVVVQDDNGCLTNLNVNVTQPAVLTATYALTDPICNNDCTGEISVTAAGGTPAYQYSANGGALQPSLDLLNLCSGNNTIMVQDNNGCQITSVQNLGNPPPFQIDTLWTLPSFCGFNNGSLEVIANGLNGPFTYSMEGGPSQPTGEYTNLFAGAYSFVATDALGCQAQAFFGVNDIEMDGIIIEITDALCYGGSDGYIEVINSSGINPITFELDNNGLPQASGIFLDVSLGSHIITITDNGACIFTLPFTINEPDLIQFSTSSTDVTCFGGSDGTISFADTVGGVGNYQFSLDDVTYQSSPVFTGLAAGIYDVYVMDSNNCVVSQTQEVFEPAPVDFDFLVNDLTCFGNNTGVIQFAASGGLGGYTFSINNGVTFQPGATFFGLAAGSYDIVVQDIGGCTASGIVVVNEPDLLVAAYVSTPVTCFGTCDGEISVTPAGGTPTYLYSADNGVTFGINPVINLLCEGTYPMLVVDDNNCQTTANVIVTTPTQVNAFGIPTPSTCGFANGTIDASANGGIPGYTYSIDNVTFDPSPAFGGLLTDSYTIYAMDNNGCVAEVDVIVGDEPAAVITGSGASNVTCNGACNGEITITAVGGTGVIQYSIGGAYQLSNVFIGLCPGIYNLSVIDDNGCITGGPVPIEITEPTQLEFFTDLTDLYCFQNGSGAIAITASEGTPGYLYSIDNGVTFVTNSGFYLLDALVYDVVVQDTNGCQVSAQVSLAEPALMEVVDVLTTDATCFSYCDGAAVASAQGGTVIGDYFYYWSQDTTAMGTGNPLTDLCAEIYHLSVTDDNGCWDSLNFEIFEPVPMVIDSIQFTDPLCFQSCDGTITVFASTATQYSIDGGTSYVPGSFFNNLCEGPYYISVQNSDGCIAYDSSTVVMVDPPLLTVVAGPDSTLCPGTSGDIYAQGSGGMGTYIYHWDNGVDNQTQVVTPLADSLFVVTVEDTNGCISVADTTAFFLYDNLQMSVSNDTTVCPDSPVTLTSVVNSGQPAYTYQWSIAGVIISTDSSIAVNPAQTTEYAIEVSDFCTTLYDTVMVNTFVVPPVVVQFTDPLCFQSCDGTITITDTPGSLYSIDGGATFGPDFIYDNLCEGPYYIAVETADGCLAYDSSTVVMVDPTLLTVVAGPDSILCPGSSGTIYAQGNGGTGTYIYHWDNGIDAQSQVVSPPVTTTYIVTVEDENGCISVADQTIFDVYDNLQISVSNDTTICPDTPITLNSIVNSGQPPYVYEWSTGGSVLGTSSSINVSPAQNTQYTIEVSDFCTTVVETIQVNTFYAPEVTFSSTEEDGCTPMEVTINPMIDPLLTMSNCVWTLSNGQQFNGCGGFTATFADLGCYDLTFSGTTPEGCPLSGFGQDVFCVHPYPTVDFEFNPQDPTYIDSDVQFTNLSEGADFFNWTFSGYPSSTEVHPFVQFFQSVGGDTIWACLEATTIYGCAVDTCKPIVMIEPYVIYTPNTFTPDGDEYNNVFTPQMPSDYQIADYHLLIFNRWGELVFESYDIAFGWDGTYNGKMMQDGTYTWKLVVKDVQRNQTHEYVGHVNVLR